MVFRSEYVDSSFRGVQDARECFKEPILGTVSQILTMGQMNEKKMASPKKRNIGLVVFAVLLIIVVKLVS